MKKIGKISINPEKVIKNEELVNLKGGYDGLCTTYCYDGSNNVIATISSPYNCDLDSCPPETMGAVCKGGSMCNEW